jgi:hypothetical protein
MENKRNPKNAVNGKYKERAVGKPRTRWEDVVWRNTSHILGIRGWRNKHKAEKNGGVF